MESVRSATSSCRQSTRSAEQRWPALSKAEGQDVAHDLLGQRRGIDDHRVLPAGFGDQRDRLTIARDSGRQLQVDQACHIGGPGKDDAGGLRMTNQGGADIPRTR